MRITALRSIAKINHNVLQNSCRLHSFKFEMTPAKRPASDQQEESAPAAEDTSKKPPTNFRYQVFQPRTSAIEKPSMEGDTSVVQRQSAKAAIEEQHLQPAMLPEYFQKQMEKNALMNPDPECSEGNRTGQGQLTQTQRRFQVSKTCANAILPLKSVKLANPFPEPVKMMMSRTVSDDEKAEQMLADARSQRQLCDAPNKNFRTFATAAKRWFSSSSKEKSSVVTTDSDKCKKAKKKTEKGGACPKMHLKGCPPIQASTTCKREARNINCKKQEAPYPAYSEFCHEDPPEKPSECKLCPWRPEDNPNFKPPKKKFHTSSGAKVRRSGLEMEYQEAEVDVDVEEAVAGEQRKGMQCDLRKPPCDRPKDTRCPAPKDKKTKDEKKKKDKKKTVSQFLEDEILGLKTRPAFSLSLSSSDKGEPCKTPCKKFKFPECKQKVKEKEIVEDKCPKKKKKRKIVDCPPEDENKKCAPLRELVGYSLTGGGGNDKEKKKCPEIDLTVFREDREDPCTLKRKGTTKVCPGDLLKKKKRGPKKKASGIITPVESKTKMPQQRKTI